MRFVLAATLLVGCFGVPNPKIETGAPRTPPDRQYLLESSGGKQRVLVWDCIDGSRIVMTNSCRITCDGDWSIHKSVCGGGDGWWDVPAEQRKPMPGGNVWVDP